MNQNAHLLQLLGEINAIMIETANIIRTASSVLQVVRACDIRNYEESSVFEAFVEAETKNGPAYCWWFEVRFSDGNWVVNRSIHKTTAAGQDVVKECPDQTFRTMGELNETISNLATRFFSTARAFDFDNGSPRIGA